jgi:adenylate cyclase class IV
MKYELEMAFIVHDVRPIFEMLKFNGFEHSSTESQKNIYMYHPFFPTMIEDKKYLRFRYCSKDDDATWGEISFSNPRGETVNGRATEVRQSFGKEYITGHIHIEIHQKFMEMLGWKEGVVMMKERDYFFREGKKEETRIHFEVDHDIVIKSKKDDLPDVELEPTVQICIESGEGEEVDKEALMAILNEMATGLGIPPGSMITKNYFDRYLEKIGN